ncbi:hypothetical protein NQ314_009843 [Rhamnusium bicolor]|uniref:Uncharacterized protein n=1 Tax=Rhamnusium bicolor TaxID=1586634 RepID=A0AAV8XXJ6_9CUCU|nr:hypothetical protein NQ314_009843 [Rhamnusium bicolor]
MFNNLNIPFGSSTTCGFHLSKHLSFVICSMQKLVWHP